MRKKIWACLLALILLIQPLETLAQTDDEAGFFIAESENPDTKKLLDFQMILTMTGKWWNLNLRRV